MRKSLSSRAWDVLTSQEKQLIAYDQSSFELMLTMMDKVRTKYGDEVSDETLRQELDDLQLVGRSKLKLMDNQKKPAQ